jgi:hypothetical protein
MENDNEEAHQHESMAGINNNEEFEEPLATGSA